MSQTSEELLTIREAAGRYKVHEDTLRSWIRKGILPYLRVGPFGIIRLRRGDLERVVEPGDQVES